MASYNPQANREWWAQRWFDVLESFGRTLRSARAHTYAREGNVLSIEFRGPKVLAQVQGRRDHHQGRLELGIVAPETLQIWGR